MIFLDDERSPTQCVDYMRRMIGKHSSLYLEDWTVVKSYLEFVRVVKKNIGKITYVSFDHDLGDGYNKLSADEYFHHEEKTGCDCATYMIELYREKDLELPIVMVHSLNPIGRMRIQNLFK